MNFIRTFIYGVSAGLTVWVYSLDEGPLGMGLVPTLWFGLFASVSLYLAILPGPLYDVFPRLQGRSGFLQARRAFGIGAAVFGALHGYHGLFGWVGGFAGLRDWSADYNLSLLLGGIALLILVVLAFTSSDVAMSAMGARWKRLHRLVYPAGVLVIAHAAIVTIHVLELMPWLIGSFVAISFLTTLVTVRLARRVPRRQPPVWGAWAVSMAVLFWAHFLISHHRH